MVENQIRAVELDAEIKQVKSMGDHSYNVILNVPEYCLPQVKQLMEWVLSAARVIINVES